MELIIQNSSNKPVMEANKGVMTFVPGITRFTEKA